MNTLICGSIAFDSIMVFNGRFKDHILPDKVHILNVAFLVPQLRREFGGTAGNIAYNLQRLGGAPLPMATVGHDAAAYLQRLDAFGIASTHLRRIDDSFTAQAFITTDLDDNQITAFHPGAMAHSHLNSVPADGSVTLGIIAPDSREGMLAHAAQFAEHGIPFVFDPGQQLPMFDADELDAFIARAHYLAVNDYEAQLLVEKTGQSLHQLSARVQALVVTRGGHGSDIHRNGEMLHIPAARTDRVVDPTGCGDAYRAGLLYGLAEGMDWETTGRLAAVLGAMKIEYHGAQNHPLDRAIVADRFAESFGYRPW